MEFVTQAQADQLRHAVEKEGLNTDSILEELGVLTFSELPASKFEDAKALIDVASGSGSSWV